MSFTQRIVLLLLAGLLSLGITAGCISDDDDSSDSSAVVETLTAISGGTEATSTEESAEPPSPSETPATDPEESPGPSPTPPALESIAPAGSVEVPDDLLSIMPTLEDLPDGLEVANDGEADLTFATADFADGDARAQQLQDWGFEGAIFREMSAADDQSGDDQEQLSIVLAQAFLLGSPEAAQLEMHSFMDEIVLGDAEFDTEETSVDPIGDVSRAATGQSTSDGETRSFAVLSVAAGPLSLRFIAAGSESYDSLPDLITAAEASLGALSYSALPALGDVLLETDFSDWSTGEVDSGTIEFDEENRYRFTVNQGDGAFIFARSSGHDPFTDVAVSVDIRMLSEDPAAQACLLSRIDPVDDQYSYAFCVDGAGNVGAHYEDIDSDGNFGFDPLLESDEVTVPPPVDWTTLTIIARGEEFWFLIDDELVGKARHAGATGGSAGITVSNLATDPDTPAEFAFNNLVVQAVE